jgi:predicted secreted Zn-dependent protease
MFVAIAAIAIGGGAGVLASAVFRTETPLPTPAAVVPLSVPPVSTPVPSGTPPPTPPPTPAPTPEPTPRPYLGRLAGTWLLTYRPDQIGTAAGLYATDELLTVRPACTADACAGRVAVADPRKPSAESPAVFRFSAAGYSLKHTSTSLVLCVGRRGLTVEGGAKATATLVLRAMSLPGNTEVSLEGTRTVKVVPTAVGKVQGCGAGNFATALEARRLSAAQLASVAQFIQPRPLADLVKRPNFTVKVAGVRMVYFAVAGDGARALMDNWAKASTKSKYCGRITYSWYKGSGESVSCIKATYNPSWSYAANPWTGSCVLRGFSLGLRMTMPIARWTAPAVAPRSLITWWKATLTLVRDHEAHHVAIYRKWEAVLKSRIIGTSCSSGQAIINKWAKQVDAAQEAFDKKDYASQQWPPYPADAP